MSLVREIGFRKSASGRRSRVGSHDGERHAPPRSPGRSVVCWRNPGPRYARFISARFAI
jgi:hypothetical protein